MKEIITRVHLYWEGTTLCTDEMVNDEILEREEENLKQWVTGELGLDDECIDFKDIKITFEVRDVK